MAKENDIAVHAVKGNWSLNGSMESKIVLTMFAMIAEIERDLISERTKEGLRARKADGVKIGRAKGCGKRDLISTGRRLWRYWPNSHSMRQNCNFRLLSICKVNNIYTGILLLLFFLNKLIYQRHNRSSHIMTFELFFHVIKKIHDEDKI